MPRPAGAVTTSIEDEGMRYITIEEYRTVPRKTDDEICQAILEEITKMNNIYCFYKYQQAKLII